MQKLKRSHAVDGVGADKPFDLAAVADVQAGFVEVADFGELVAYGFVGSDAVGMATFRPTSGGCGHTIVCDLAREKNYYTPHSPLYGSFQI